MINFRYIQWENLLSTGANPTRVQLDSNPTTLIVGKNGSGKSTMLDALSFALFGKPHRDIKKAQLVNTINTNKMVVECGFDIGTHNFVIIRGIKPARFEIYQNGNMINQQADSRDYQKFLEQNILKLNHKSFHQIVVLGSSSFIPFMQLKSTHRREVIEDLLDIRVFTVMNGIVKENLSRIKESSVVNNHSLDKLESNITMQRNYIRDIGQIAKDQSEQKKERMDRLQEQYDELSNEYDDLIGQYPDQLSKVALNKLVEDDRTSKQQLNDRKHTFNHEIKMLVKTTKFYQDNDMCPTCDQNIDSNVKEHKHTEAKTRAKFLQEEIREVDDQLATLNNSISKLTDQLKVADMIDSEGTKIMNLRQNVSRMMVEYQKDLDQIGDTHGDLKGANKTLSCMIEDRTSLFDEKATLAESKSYYDAIFEMLRDTGIKTKIIKQYLPAMNKLINHYLQALDFFVSFNIDESFQEEIRSRYRDTFNYASFSEGEKQRIDLALLFTWRKVAAMKNSASTNLLVLDETFDSSLDTEGIENLMKILDTIDDGTNTFIISHKGDVLESKFENKIEFVTHNNFSEARI